MAISQRLYIKFIMRVGAVSGYGALILVMVSYTKLMLWCIGFQDFKIHASVYTQTPQRNSQSHCGAIVYYSMLCVKLKSVKVFHYPKCL